MIKDYLDFSSKISLGMKDHGAAVDVGVASDKGHSWFFSVFTIGNIDFENIRGRAFFDIGDGPVMS